MVKKNSLREYVKNKRKYIKLTDGETITATYQGYDFVPSKFNADEEIVRYKLEVDGEVKPWDTSATSVADEFSNIEPGQSISITRHGSGTNTKYEVSQLS